MTPNQADKLVLNQAILRHKEKQVRQNREIPIPNGDGWISKGSVFDCNRHTFERALKAYWDRLYVGWNPMKREGRGCWEVWQRPSHKLPILEYHNKDTGEKIFRMEYKPNDYEHWVADLDFLSLGFIQKLRSMDSWENKQLVSNHDHAYEDHQQKLEEAENDNIKQVVKENKRYFRDLLDYTQLGYEPTQFFRGGPKRK